ncbi:MAG: OmcA/MtrC family decaheme c-type cytochrome [Candidatus Hydrogenedentes bacterium]|nr:OmcA/MtrC family decaheme c-type cytochrome [Candidatus Hydrogenedentota bacterium]
MLPISTSRRMAGMAVLSVLLVAVLVLGCPRQMKVSDTVAAAEIALASSGVDADIADAALAADDDNEKAALPGQYSGHAPGLIVTITSVKIPKDRRPIVNFTATDERGETVGKNELTDVRFILAYLGGPLDRSTLKYISYNTRIENPDGVVNNGDEAVQATYDTALLAGVKQKNNGAFRYKFATALPVGYDKAASHQVGGQFRRTFGANGVSYPANAVLAFRPDGGKAVLTRDVVDNETCNQCHTRLALHGEIRRDIQLCILCHTPQSTDAQSGNSVDMAQMIHKIHMGAELPSVVGGDQYQIVGFGNTVHDYSTVHYPPAPQDVRNCESCHSGTAGAGAETFHLDNPTIEGCGSCHDRTWFGEEADMPDGYELHLEDVPLFDNSLCSTCHKANSSVEPIIPAHLLPQETEDAPGLKYEVTDYDIVEVATAPKLKIYFTAKNGADEPITNLDSNAAISLSGLIAWPVEDYTTRVQNTIQGSGESGTLVNDGGGAYTYTFSSALPLGSTDTFAMALQSRISFTHDGATVSQGLESNQRFIFTLDDSEPVERRAIADEAACNVCHVEVRFHGEQRVGVDFCVMCHTTVQTDETRRDPALGVDADPETVNMKDMIHAIHRGEELEDDYTVYGFGNVAHDFTEIRFPGREDQCVICHVADATNLPTPIEALPTVITENGGQPVLTKLPQSASCNSCHDSFAAVLHAALNSDLAGGDESCEVCHGVDAEFSVERVHALEP